MKSLIASIAILGVLGLAVGVGTQAVEEIVTATVCPTLVSLTLSANTVDYGVKPIPSTNLVPSPASVTVKNNGNVAENFLVKGDDATTTGGTWTLVGTVGTDQYIHRSSPDNSTFTALTKTNASLGAGNVSADSACEGTDGDGGTRSLFLKMDTPTVSNVQGQYSAPVTVTAVAS